MPSNISLSDRAKAVEAMRKREILRKTTSFQDWLPQVTPKFTWTWKHLLLIFKALNDVATGKTKRLMIFMPPRSGKSEAVTVRFPAWMIERNPELRFIVAAYNVSLASKFSRKTQRIVSARGIELDREAVDDWTTNKEGGIRAVGVGSGVTGHGANGILIDDPIKPLAIDTPVPTPSGWKMLGDLQIGDKVFDHTGCICNIINVTPHYTAPRMRVTFSDNSTIDAHPSHPWKAFSRDDHAIYTQKYKNYDSLWPTWKSNGKAKVQTVTTSHIAATLTARITMRNWTIPVCGALELPEAVLPIDPYLLGYWLGDGTSAEAAVTVGNKDVPHFLSHIMAIGYVIHSDKANDKGAHRISVSTTYRKQNKWGDSLTRRLRELGVLNNKHIPGIYLRASIQQRLALLRGLMDSDGTIEKTYGETTFVSTSKPLADGTHELIVSLGGKVVVSTRPAANKTAYILRGFYTFQPFALPRKAQRNTAPGQIRRRNRTIVNVEKLDNCEHVCITVDSDSHLFLAGKGMIPVCNSKEEAYSVVYRDKAWEWYKDDLYTRLEPNGFIILTLCMTGDTRVLMADGSEKLLVNINIGDEIATYEDGQLTTSTVRNWKNQGYDNTLTIALASGITVRANERHPFLVSRNGGTEWIRLKELVAGDKIVRVMARTKGLNVQSMDVKNLQSVEGNVHPITARHCGQVGIGRRDLVPSQEGQYDCVEDTELNTQIMNQSLPSKKANVPFVECHPQEKTPLNIGTMETEDSVLTMTMNQGRYEDSYATSAISLLVTEEQKKFYSTPLNTYEITLDCVVDISKAGHEEVFDIQVERTENFIANGLVSHNTRWHYDDLAGRILKADTKKEWTVLKLPALAEQDDPMDRLEGEALCPERFNRDDLLSIKTVMGSDFESLYQQNPTAVQGSIFKREWWKYYKERPEFTRIIQSWDTAFKEKKTNDPSNCQTWGVTNNGYYLIDRWQDRVTFPDLKRAAVQQYDKWKPDVVIVEDKASGQCYSDDTEVLTQRGWLLFTDIDIACDKFATRNPQTKEFEWQYATGRIDKNYSGEIYHFHGRPIDILVTPEHRMLITSLPRKLGGDGHRSGEVVIQARELFSAYNKGLNIPVTSIWKGQKIKKISFPMDKEKQQKRIAGRIDSIGRRVTSSEPSPITMSGDDYCAFMGMYLSEGWCRIQESNRSGCTFICQSENSPYIKVFADALNKIFGRKVNYSAAKRQFSIGRRGLAEHVAYYGKKAWDKFIPDKIMNATPEQLQIFWDFYFLGDGCNVNGMETITTTSRRLAGQLVEIAQKIGFHASVSTKIPTKSVHIPRSKNPTLPENLHTIYVVRLRTSKTMGFHADKATYSGMVHCISVPNGIIYVRRNGKPIWCGQSLIQEIQRETKIPMLAVKSDKDKISRANAVTPLCESGHVFLPEGASWVAEYIDQMALFPAAAHDEDPDVTSQALNYLSHGTKFFGDCRFEDDPEEVKPQIFVPEPIPIIVKKKRMKVMNPNIKRKPMTPSVIKRRKK